MILGNPGALYLFTLALGIILLYFLRTYSRYYEVSALFLWEGLAGDPRTRAARIKRKIDPLLLIQLLVLALVTLAVAQPSLVGTAPHLSGMAIVLDGSASMRTRTESGVTRYDLAREEAITLLDTYPTSPVALIQLSSSPQVLVPLTEDHDQARITLSAAQPTWGADGTAAMLQGLLTSQGGRAGFERVVYLTDRPLATPLPGVEERIVTGGENAAITAFTVREDPDLQGVTAFAKVRNDTSAYYDAILRVSDGADEVQLSALLPPGEERVFVLPFPGAHGPTFTATLAPQDDFTGDDVRYFTLNRSLTLRVRWVGEQNRYLEAALRAVGDLTFVSEEDDEPVDLTVSYNTELPAEASGNILLVHAGLHGLVTIGEETDGGKVSIVQPDDPLLHLVDPLDFRIRSTPRVEVAGSGVTVLAVGGEPLLYRSSGANRKIVLIAPDLMRTNLPLTVDFPLLIQNILRDLSTLSAPASPNWAVVGEPIPLSGYGEPIRVTDPSGRAIPLVEAASFLPEEPGIYTLTTTKGVYPLAVNIDPAESDPPTLVSTDLAEVPHAEAQTLLPLWPLFAGLAALSLVIEAFLYQGWRPWRGYR